MTAGGIDVVQFRQALGCFATGVCVITANPHGHTPFGLTINSFASLSLAPPLILWSLQKSSETMSAFRIATGFCVNVLSAEQQPLAARYARKSQHALFADDHTIGTTRLPVLNGALALFVRDMDARHDGGDHLILIGWVRNLGIQALGRLLLFFGGAFAELR